MHSLQGADRAPVVMPAVAVVAVVTATSAAAVVRHGVRSPSRARPSVLPEPSSEREELLP
ncbi:hypothetical protein AMK16_31655 [Streptomyces sp. CB00455]|nr:hypothetical protein AMK16_31655 [Streptomyces sp. CB00455]